MKFDSYNQKRVSTMKKMIFSFLGLLLISNTFLRAQELVLRPVDEKITPGMTEVWDPEVKIIAAGSAADVATGRNSAGAARRIPSSVGPPQNQRRPTVTL